MKRELGAKVIRIHTILAGIPSANISLDVDEETNKKIKLTPYFKIPVIVRKNEDLLKVTLLPSEWIKIYSGIRQSMLKSSSLNIVEVLDKLDITATPKWNDLDLGVEDHYEYSDEEIRWIMATLCEQPDGNIRSSKQYVLQNLQAFCAKRGFNKK